MSSLAFVFPAVSLDAVCEAKTHKLDLTIKLADGQLVLTGLDAEILMEKFIFFESAFSFGFVSSLELDFTDKAIIRDLTTKFVQRVFLNISDLSDLVASFANKQKVQDFDRLIRLSSYLGAKDLIYHDENNTESLTLGGVTLEEMNDFSDYFVNHQFFSIRPNGTPRIGFSEADPELELGLVKDPEPYQIRWLEKLLPSELACLRSILVRPGFDPSSKKLLGELFVALFCRPKMREEDFECLSQVRPEILECGLDYIIHHKDQKINGTLLEYSEWYTKVLEKSVWINDVCNPSLYIFEHTLAYWTVVL